MVCRHCGSEDLKKVLSDYFKCNKCGKGTTPKSLKHKDCTEYADDQKSSSISELEVK